jgi:hypothetical protein
MFALPLVTAIAEPADGRARPRAQTGDRSAGGLRQLSWPDPTEAPPIAPSTWPPRARVPPHQQLALSFRPPYLAGVISPEPASPAAPGLNAPSSDLTPQQLAVIARQRARVAFATALFVGTAAAVMVDEAGRWTEATPLGFTVGDHGYVTAVDPHGRAAAVSVLKHRFPTLAVRTVEGRALWRQLPQNHVIDGVVVDGSGEVLLRLDTRTVELRFFAHPQVARGGWTDGCPEEPHVQSDDDGLTPDERAACTITGRSIVFGGPTATASAASATRVVRIPGGGTTLWAGLLLSVALATLLGALVRRFHGRGPDDAWGREQLRRRSFLSVVMAAGLVVPLLAHAFVLVIAAGFNMVSVYATVALVTTGLPHVLMMFHLHRSATTWLAGTFSTRPLSIPIVVAAAIPGIVFVIPTVGVLILAAGLHLALRRWVRRVLSDDAVPDDAG